MVKYFRPQTLSSIRIHIIIIISTVFVDKFRSIYQRKCVLNWKWMDITEGYDAPPKKKNISTVQNASRAIQNKNG